MFDHASGSIVATSPSTSSGWTVNSSTASPSTATAELTIRAMSLTMLAGRNAASCCARIRRSWNAGVSSACRSSVAAFSASSSCDARPASSGNSRDRCRELVARHWPTVIAVSAMTTAGSASPRPPPVRLASRIESSAHFPASTWAGSTRPVIVCETTR